MAITINGIVCQEIVDQFSEQFDLLNGPTAKKGFLCNWGDRYTVAVGLLGLNYSQSIGVGITIHTPMPYPEISTMYANRIEIEPKGPPTQGTHQLQYPQCIVWCYYQCLPWSFSGLDDPSGQNSLGAYIYAEQQMDSSVEWVSVPGRYTKFATGGKPTGSDYGFRLAIVEMLITIHRMPYLPSTQVLSLSGYINNQTFLGVKAGYLLFNGTRTHQTRSTDGTINTDVTYSFSARSQRWDYAYNPAKPGWDQVLDSATGQPFIPSTDLSVAIPQAFQY